jgi:hypothetical protein
VIRITAFSLGGDTVCLSTLHILPPRQLATVSCVTRIDSCSQEAKALTSGYSSFPETKNSTWQSEFIAASTEGVRERWLERIGRAENAILHRIGEMEALPARLGDVDERCAMSCALTSLRAFRVQASSLRRTDSARASHLLPVGERNQLI